MSVNLQDNRSPHFVHLAYTACYTGDLLHIPNEEVKAEMIRVVLDDLCTSINTFPKAEREIYLKQMQHRLSGGH